MSAVIGGVILLGLWAVWLDHRRKRYAAIIRAAQIQAEATVRAAEVHAAAIREAARAQHPTAAPKGAAALRALTERQKN